MDLLAGDKYSAFVLEFCGEPREVLLGDDDLFAIAEKGLVM